MLKSGMSPAGGRAGAPSGAGRCAAGRHEDGPGAGNAGPRGRDGSFAPRARDGGRPGFAGRGCTPHSFSSCRKRMRRARWKKKTLGRKTGARRRLFCLNAGVVRIHAAETCQAPAGCAVPQRNRERAPRIWYCAAAFRGGHRKGFTISPARSASLRAPPVYPREGNPKGRGRSPAPLRR